MVLKDFPVKTVAAGAKELETLLITDQTGLEEKAPDEEINALTKFVNRIGLFKKRNICSERLFFFDR